MGVLDDVRKWLNDVPLWKELGTIPDRTKALDEKVRELEDKLNGKWPADVCKFCGERAMRLFHSYPSLGEKGYMREDWKCEKCGKQEPARAAAPWPRPCVFSGSGVVRQRAAEARSTGFPRGLLSRLLSFPKICRD
jgi:hypothetical protein